MVLAPLVAPGWPPCEEARVVRVEGAQEIHQIAVDDRLEQGALLRQLAHRARVAHALVDVHVGARDVEIAADEELVAGRAGGGGVGDERAQKGHLGRQVAVAVRDVHREHAEGADGQLEGAELDVEGSRGAAGGDGAGGAPDVQAHAGVAARATVPHAVVVRQPGERFGHLRRGRLDLLQAQDVRLFAAAELDDLGETGPDPVHVPGDDPHGGGRHSTSSESRHQAPELERLEPGAQAGAGVVVPAGEASSGR